ncbi:MAG: acyl-CoA thioesterase [Candidatus Aureabacteria bacterium]|nr:acyl-CoA thioesterase [Candidatus Auribacterota bacterium]
MYSIKIRVRYSETDQMGRAYYANYFVWFETARTEYFRKLGFSYRELEKKGLFLPVVHASCDYKNKVEYDDEISINCKAAAESKMKLVFHYEITGEKGAFIASGSTIHVFIDASGRPVKIPEEIAGLLKNEQ